MKRVALLFLLPLFSACDSGSPSSGETYSSNNQPSIETVIAVGFDIASFFVKNPLIRMLSFLDVVGSWSSSNAVYVASSQSVRFPTQNPHVTGIVGSNSTSTDDVLFDTPSGIVSFSPNEFIRLNNLAENDPQGLRQLNEKMLNDYSQCSEEVLNSGEGNHIKMLEMRFACLQNRGYTDVNLNYMRIKHEKYINI